VPAAPLFVGGTKCPARPLTLFPPAARPRGHSPAPHPAGRVRPVTTATGESADRVTLCIR